MCLHFGAFSAGATNLDLSCDLLSNKNILKPSEMDAGHLEYRMFGWNPGPGLLFLYMSKLFKWEQFAGEIPFADVMLTWWRNAQMFTLLAGNV